MGYDESNDELPLEPRLQFILFQVLAGIEDATIADEDPEVIEIHNQAKELKKNIASLTKKQCREIYSKIIDGINKKGPQFVKIIKDRVVSEVSKFLTGKALEWGYDLITTLIHSHH